MTLTFRVLGPLQVWRSGNRVRITAAKPRALLALLVMRAGQTLSNEDLIDELWGGSPPQSALANLRTYVTGLRQALGDDAAAIAAQPGGYRVWLAPSQLDLYEFRELVERGRGALGAHNAASAVELLDRAQAMWRGGALADVRAGPALSGYAAALDEERLAAIEDGAEARLLLGQYAEVVPAMRSMLAGNPLRERAAALLMTALYGCGDAAGALSVFTATRVALVSQLGIEPGPELHRLHQAVLSRDPGLDTVGMHAEAREAQQQARAAARTPTPVHQLPPVPTILVGRAGVLGKIKSIAGNPHGPRVVAIHGAAGIGKSTLAAAAAHDLAGDYPDGQLFVDLRGADPHGGRPVPVASALAWLLQGLGTPAAEIPTDPGQAAALLRSTLTGRRVLLLLDDAAGLAQAGPLLPASPQCLVLITSRRMLVGLEGATHVTIDPLDGKDSVALLSAIAGAERVEAEPEAAAAIADYCGHLPLALKVSAARLARRPGYPLSRLANRLADERRRLDELELQDMGVRPTLRVSYDALCRSENAVDQLAARAFRLCGLLAPRSLGPAAVAVALDCPVPDAEAALDRLVELRLLEPAGPDAVRMHDLLRLFAAEQATGTGGTAGTGDSAGTGDTAGGGPADGEQAAVRRVYLDYLRRAREAASHVRPFKTWEGHPGRNPAPAVTQAVAWLEEQLPSLLAIARHCAAQPELLGDIVCELLLPLHLYLPPRGQWAQMLELAQLTLDTATARGDRVGRARALTVLALTDQQRGALHDALLRLNEAMEIRQELGDRPAEGAVLDNLGLLYTRAGQPLAAFACYARALRLHREFNRTTSAAITMHNLAWVYEELGRVGAAERFLRRCLALRQGGGDRIGEATTLVSLGRIRALQGRTSEAVTYLTGGIEMGRNVRYVEAECEGLICRAEIQRRDGRVDAAMADLERATALAEDNHDRYLATVAQWLRGRTADQPRDLAAPAGGARVDEVLIGYPGPRNRAMEQFLGLNSQRPPGGDHRE